MKVDNVVKSMWIDPIIGKMQTVCMRSFVENKIEYHLYVYDDIKNLPNGIVLKDANEILDQSLIFKDRKNTYATFSDWFRIKLLFDKGGWWVDSDVLLVKKFNFRSRYVFATESYYYEEELKVRICNAVLKMPAKSRIGYRILNRIEHKLNQTNVVDIDWTEIGAGFLRDEILNMELEHYIFDPAVFCPNAWNTFDAVVTDSASVLDERTYAIHLWNNMWEWNGLQPMDMITENSLLIVFRRIQFMKNS